MHRLIQCSTFLRPHPEEPEHRSGVSKDGNMERGRAGPSCEKHASLRAHAPQDEAGTLFAHSVLDLLLDVDRYGERECRAFADLGLDPDATAMHFDDALGDSEAEPSAALLLGGRGVGLLEL